MQIEIHGGTVDLSGESILTDINMTIYPNSRIAVVGRNGCGKTTLLRLLSGELTLSNREGDGGFMSGRDSGTISTLKQITFSDDTISLEQEIRSAYKKILDIKKKLDAAQREMELTHSEESIKSYSDLLYSLELEGGFYFEKEYEAAIKKFGFSDEEKRRPLCEFSGGQRTKIAFLKLLLSKPDLLLLDEPTNHLDIEAVNWLEDYIRNYKKAVVIVSHDRMFLDNTVNEVYEIEYGKIHHYHGNYTDFTRQKKQRRELEVKKYDAQQKEIARISATAERFRYKATKAAMAQSKLKSVERMEKLDAPVSFDERTFKAELTPSCVSAKQVISANDLSIGFDKSLATLSFEIYRGDRVGIIGGNGTGKSTLLKTIVGECSKLGGSINLGAMVKIGYFDQQLAQIKGGETVLQNMLSAFPQMSEFEARSALGGFLFTGEDVFKTIDMLSGGEKVRLALCKLFRSRPNLLILDEPTNHMDIISKETLEEILEAYEGTLIFVSHDRYFVNRLAKRLIAFEDNTANFYDLSYKEYTERKPSQPQDEKEKTVLNKANTKSKKSFTTPLKEKARRERAINKCEQEIIRLEAQIDAFKSEQSAQENITDYEKLTALQEQIEELEQRLLEVMAEWESLTDEDV